MKNILLVEDDPFLVDIYATSFKKADFNVDVAHNQEAALEKMENHLPDLLILDIELPRENNGLPQPDQGWEILKAVRNNPKTKDIKVIVISNFDQKDYVDNISQFGVIKYFLKIESTPEEIIQTIKEILA